MYRNITFVFKRIPSDILVFDDLGVENLVDLIKPYSYFIFKIRSVIYIDPIAILMTIKFITGMPYKKNFQARGLLKRFYLKQGLLGLARIIKVIYVSKFILRHRISSVVTFCDDSPIIQFP